MEEELEDAREVEEVEDGQVKNEWEEVEKQDDEKVEEEKGGIKWTRRKWRRRKMWKIGGSCRRGEGKGRWWRMEK